MTESPKPVHIGIVGISPEGAAVFYSQLSRQCSRLLPPDRHPTISVHNAPLSDYLEAIRRDDWHAVGELMRRSAEMLARVGARFCLTPDNIVQHGAHLAESGSPIPWLLMADMVASAVAKDGRKTVGVLGTKMVTQSSTYQTLLGIRGVHFMPPEPHEADRLDQILFDEVIYGTIRAESRAAVLDVIQHMKTRGCDGVILACSEAPLLVSRENCSLPLYDAADILAEGAVRKAIEMATGV